MGKSPGMGFSGISVDKRGASEWWINGLKTTILVTLLALCIGVVLGFSGGPYPFCP